ncbi:hypothetical protein UFOVP115_99 [uncultured Caudovirales phage]|uniref:Uncharacterized protein n=1 Tax=uncultured Caudovirales phage TaxID=2100421 RepID=A0A6J5L8R8_9CAUD|nr:hypothetical protein UFOVP115_99 [uncultured Caudovirales phage]
MLSLPFLSHTQEGEKRRALLISLYLLYQREKTNREIPMDVAIYSLTRSKLISILCSNYENTATLATSGLIPACFPSLLGSSLTACLAVTA